MMAIPNNKITTKKCDIQYNISSTNIISYSSLVDRGANGGVSGADMRIMNNTHKTVRIQGIDSHQVNNIPIVTAGGIIDTNKGYRLYVFHQYAYMGRGIR